MVWGLVGEGRRNKFHNGMVGQSLHHHFEVALVSVILSRLVVCDEVLTWKRTHARAQNSRKAYRHPKGGVKLHHRLINS